MKFNFLVDLAQISGSEDIFVQPQIPLMAKIIPILIFVFVIFFMVRIFGARREIIRDVKSRNFNKLSQGIMERINLEGISDKDIFNSNEVYETRIRKLGKGKFRWSKFNDLFSDLDKENVGAYTEMRYILSKPSFKNFKGLKGFTVTRTKNDWILIDIREGLIYVKLNNLDIGIMDLEKKKIYKDDKIIGTLDFPDLFARNITKITYDIHFANKKEAKVVASQNYFKNLAQKYAPNARIKTAEIKDTLSKQEFAFVLALIHFLKIKNSLYPK